MEHNEQEYQELKARYNDAIAANATLRAKVERLEKAVKWACKHAEDYNKLYAGEYEVSAFANELRRLAKEG